MSQKTWSVSLVAALALGCGYEVYTEHETEGCPVGSAGCPCAEDSGCEGALVCLDGVCSPGEGESTTSAAPGAGTGTSAGASTGAGMSSSGTTSADPGACGDDGSRPETTGMCEFICEPDPPPGDALCDVWAQDCCGDQKCVPYDYDGDGSWERTKCVPITGDGQHGEPCAAEPITEGGDDCGLGVMCWYLDEEGAGTCVDMCTGAPEDPSCAPSLSFCNVHSDGALNLCIDSCDALAQDCPDGAVCIGDPNGDGFVCVVDSSGGMGPEGTPCEFANVCNPGLMCVNPDFYPGPDCAGSIGCCAPFCDTGQPGACEGLSVAEATCVSFYAPEPAPEGFEAVGVCGVQG